MKHHILWLSLLFPVQTMTAQTVQDSTDVFFRHLNLNEVLVTGLTGQSHLKEMPVPVSVITKRDLQATASTNVIDAIAKKPGVSQITTGSGISKPVIRGLGYNRVAVVSDGIRQEGQQWGDEHGVEIDGHSISQVEILKGPSSLMYGSDAMAGVILFQPNRVAPLGTMQANVSTGYQTNNGLFDYSVNFGGNKNGIVWDGRWSQKMAHAYQNAYDGYVPGSQFSEQAARLMLGLNRTWGHTHFTASYYHLKPGIIEGERDAVTGELEGFDATNEHTYEVYLPFQHVYHYEAVLDNALQINEKGQLKLITGYQQNCRQEFEESADECSLHFLLHTLNYDLRYQYELSDEWKFVTGVGGMYQQSLNKGEEYLIPAYNLFDIGFFVTVSHRWKRWHMTGGLRVDRRHLHSREQYEDGALRFSDFTRNFSGLSASLGAVFHASEQLNLRANLSRGFRAPNLSELGSNGVHEGTQQYEVGNQSLKAEYSWQADLGADFSSTYVSAMLSLFANRINNYIYVHRTSDVIDPNYDTYRYDAGNARLMGFEAQVDVHPVHQLHLMNAFGMVDAVQLDQPHESKYLPFTPAPCWTSEVKYELTHHEHALFSKRSSGLQSKNAYVSLEMECHLRQNHYLMADDTETATPSYTLFNLSAGTDVLFNGRHVASLYLTGENLFDKAYQNHLSRLKYTDVNNATGRRGIYNMGRNIALRLIVPISL